MQVAMSTFKGCKEMQSSFLCMGAPSPWRKGKIADLVSAILCVFLCQITNSDVLPKRYIWRNKSRLFRVGFGMQLRPMAPIRMPGSGSQSGSPLQLSADAPRGNSRGWLKDLGFCYPSGRPGWICWVPGFGLAQP